MKSKEESTLKKQVAGFLLSPDWVNDPGLSYEYIDEMAAHGYRAAVLFVRHMHKTLWDRKVRDCVEKMVEHAHKAGIKFVLDTDHKWWGQEFVEDCPEASMKVIGSYRADLNGGAFEFRADYPRVKGICVIDSMPALFLEESGGYRRIPGEAFSYEWQNYGVPKKGVFIRGSVKGAAEGKLRAYVSFKTPSLVDAANPRYLKRQKELLDFYSDIPVDGFGWDEPGKGMGRLDYFKSGDAFLELFRELNGYELLPKIVFLDNDDFNPEAVKIRCDYYRTLVEMNYRAQKEHNDYASRVFGEDLMFGTHQTWSGVPTDLAAGSVDYFRLGELLTASWTDGSWSCELKYQAFHHMLSDGIRNELGLSDAYYNDWTKEMPCVEDMHFATRFKMLFNVNWFNVFFSHFSENEVNYRLEPLRTRAASDAKALDEFDGLLGDEFYPGTDIAWFYTWEGIAGAPKWLARAFYTSCANTAQHLADSGLFASMLGSESLLRAEISNGCFSVNGQSYRTLLVPFGNVLSRECFRKIIRLSEAGINVVFQGPPPEFADDGEGGFLEEFSGLMGIEPLGFSKLHEKAEKADVKLTPNGWEPEWIDLASPVKASKGVIRHDSEGRLLYVKSPDMPLYYLPWIDPREDLISLLKLLNPPVEETFAEKSYVRVFRSRISSDRRVVLTAAKGRIADAPLVPDIYARARPPRKYSDMKALIRLEGGELEVKNGSWSASLIEGGKVLKTIGDAGSVNYEPY